MISLKIYYFFFFALFVRNNACCFLPILKKDSIYEIYGMIFFKISIVRLNKYYLKILALLMLFVLRIFFEENTQVGNIK